MAQYIMTCLDDDQPSKPEEGKHHFAKYKEWFSSLGGSEVRPTNPLKNTSAVNPDGTITTGRTTSMSGDINENGNQVKSIVEHYASIK